MSAVPPDFPSAASVDSTAPAAQPEWRPQAQRIFHCRCGRPIFFRNSQCLACGRQLGYRPEAGVLEVLEPAGGAQWATGETGGPQRFHVRCGNFETAAACNWLIAYKEAGTFSFCRCCRLNRTVPDQSYEHNRVLWRRVELAKRRVVSALISLGLPVASRLGEDPQRGMAFDLLVGSATAWPVMTGHRDGIITLNVDEADHATREAVRSAMHEPYRTVLGHLRHESGHYYWSRLVDGTSWLGLFREVFGDERDDYGLSLQNHHADGPPGDWALRYVSAYASAHPWEDWAETWAHYLHMVDSLETAIGIGLDSSRAELLHDPFPEDLLRPDGGGPPSDDDRRFLAFVNQWVELTSIVNELSRSMGQHDFYPFVLNAPAVTKLHVVHQVVTSQRARGS